ncbi:MAG: hypothetical protein Q9184_008326 [Pyrenodesmia sp. 2 TL-2023]
MEDPSVSPSRKCFECCKSAELVCHGCKGKPNRNGNPTAIYYCSAICQKKDWNSHKPSCKASKDRQALYRAGKVAQGLHCTFRRNTWSWAIANVEREKGEVLGEIWKIFDGKHPETGYFFPFPKNLFPDIKDQEAILSYGSCREAIAFMEVLVPDLLEGRWSEIQEVSVRVKDPRLRIARWEDLVPLIPDVHDVLRIVLPNAEILALDLTAAQYGWHESSVMPWDKFMEQRVKEVYRVREFRETTRLLRAEAVAAGSPYIRLHRMWLEYMMISFSYHLIEWQGENI